MTIPTKSAIHSIETEVCITAYFISFLVRFNNGKNSTDLNLKYKTLLIGNNEHRSKP